MSLYRCQSLGGWFLWAAVQMAVVTTIIHIQLLEAVIGLFQLTFMYQVWILLSPALVKYKFFFEIIYLKRIHTSFLFGKYWGRCIWNAESIVNHSFTRYEFLGTLMCRKVCIYNRAGQHVSHMLRAATRNVCAAMGHLNSFSNAV